MKNMFDTLFSVANSERITSDYEQNILKNIEKNEQLLKKRLSKKEKKLLLRIIDNEGLLLEDTAIRNFSAGFKLGVKFGIAVEKE